MSGLGMVGRGFAGRDQVRDCFGHRGHAGAGRSSGQEHDEAGENDRDDNVWDMRTSAIQ
jgi:hypothetical protein